MELYDRVALITGATGGLGAVMACMLADEGAHVAVTHLGHRDEGSRYVDRSRQKGGRAFSFI
jgi:NAD(P)-dependent dehydrogenase (short-subunit alcohol dehydrogenase family)